MAGRPKTLAEDVDRLHFSLSPEEQLVLQLIRVRRKKRSEARSTPSEIVADGLWQILERVEGITRDQVEKLIAVGSAVVRGNVKEFRMKE